MIISDLMITMMNKVGVVGLGPLLILKTSWKMILMTLIIIVIIQIKLMIIDHYIDNHINDDDDDDDNKSWRSSSKWLGTLIILNTS